MSIRLFREGDARARIAKPIVVAVLSFSCAVAIAQQRPDAGQLLEQQREPLRLPPPEDDVRPRPPEPRPALPVSPTLKVRVTQFTFSGNTLYSDQELAEVVKEFIGKELDFEGLNDAATKVRAYHRSRGYFLAQAYLPQQAIRNGSVEIAVIEGRMGKVELQRRPAEMLLILTDVDAVYADWGTPNQRPLARLTIDNALEMDRNKAFGEGSMAPKIRAAIDFVRRTNGRAIITSLECGQQAVRGEAGTTITATETA